MADDKEPPPVRKNCTLAAATVRYLEKLKRRGTHGSSVPKVMTHLIEEGVRQAIRDGFIKQDDDEAAG